MTGLPRPLLFRARRRVRCHAPASGYQAGGTEAGGGTVTGAAAVPALAKTGAPMFSVRNDLDMAASIGRGGR
jgi:hypothetical protein